MNDAKDAAGAATVDMPAKPKKIMINVGYDLTTGECTVTGPVHLRAHCVVALATAISTIAMQKSSILSIPPGTKLAS